MRLRKLPWQSEDGQEIAIASVVILVIILALAFLGTSACKATEREVSGTVVDSYIKHSSDNDKFFAAIKKADGSTEVFEDTDSYIYWKFNSADVYQQLRAAQASNKPVRVKVYGWRTHIFSGYRDIIKVE